MNQILHPFLRQFVIVFLDDILIYSNSLLDHINHLEQLFLVLREQQFYLKPSKCTFAQESLEYLGHIISSQGVATDATKIQAMLQWPSPTTVTDLRGFLGLTGYYRRFVKNYGTLAKPPNSVVKAQAIHLDPCCSKSF